MKKITMKKKSAPKKKLYVLLTRFKSRWARLVGVLTGEYYTHVSLGFEEDLHTFYSFTFKGFLVENIQKYIDKCPRRIECILYEISVSPEKYEKIKRDVTHFVDNKNQYHYNWIGVILSLLHISWKREEHYFCSQFVAEVLEKNRIVTVKKKSTIFFPRDFHRIEELKPQYCGDLAGMLQLCALEPLGT